VCSPAEVAAIRLRWQRAIDRHILTYSRCGASDANFEADHLIVVHDSSLPEHLQNRLQTAVLQDPSVHTDRTCRALTTSTLTELDQLLDRFSPREAIARLRPLVGDELQLILEEQLSVPVGADIYRISAS
jgi:hypothetical protein